MELGGLLLTSVLKLALPPQRHNPDAWQEHQEPFIHTAPQFGMIRCLFSYSTDAHISSCLWSFNPLLLRLLGEISLSLLCSHSSRGFSFGFGPASPCRSPEGVCSPPRQDGVKGAAASGALAHSGGGRERYGGGGASLRRQRRRDLQQPKACRAFSR